MIQLLFTLSEMKFGSRQREREREIKGVVRDRERERKRRKAERGNSLYLSRLLEALIL